MVRPILSDSNNWSTHRFRPMLVVFPPSPLIAVRIVDSQTRLFQGSFYVSNCTLILREPEVVPYSIAAVSKAALTLNCTLSDENRRLFS